MEKVYCAGCGRELSEIEEIHLRDTATGDEFVVGEECVGEEGTELI